MLHQIRVTKQTDLISCSLICDIYISGTQRLWSVSKATQCRICYQQIFIGSNTTNKSERNFETGWNSANISLRLSLFTGRENSNRTNLQNVGHVTKTRTWCLWQLCGCTKGGLPMAGIHDGDEFEDRVGDDTQSTEFSDQYVLSKLWPWECWSKIRHAGRW